MTEDERRMRVFAIQIAPLIKEYIAEHREEYEAFLQELKAEQEAERQAGNPTEEIC